MSFYLHTSSIAWYRSFYREIDMIEGHCRLHSTPLVIVIDSDPVNLLTDDNRILDRGSPNAAQTRHFPKCLPTSPLRYCYTLILVYHAMELHDHAHQVFIRVCNTYPNLPLSYIYTAIILVRINCHVHVHTGLRRGGVPHAHRRAFAHRHCYTQR